MKMKNKIFLPFIAATIMIGLGSCSEWLDLRPEGEMVLDEYWQTESEAEAVMTACYRGLIEDDCTERMLVWGEMRSDNVTEGRSVGDAISKALMQEIEPTNTYTSWGSFYSVINYCNTFIKYAPTVLENDDNFTVDKLHAMEAEVYTLRALAYFYLVRAFGNVPWVSTPSIDDTQNYQVPQSTERAILDSIIGDLNKVLPYAKAKHTTLKHTKGRITKNAIHALLADIYLWDNQYDKCIKECDKIIADEDLELVKAEDMLYNVFYRGNSTESIFELQYDNDVQINYATRNFYGYSGNENGSLSFPPVLAKGQHSPFKYPVGGGVVESEEDYRLDDNIVNDPSLGVYPIFKYAGMNRSEVATSDVSTYLYRSNTSNWIVYRLSDIILMKAEALIQKDGETSLESVVSLVNMTYKRSNPDGDTLSVALYTGTADVEKLVLRERQRELMFEGKRWFDLMRMARREGSPTPVISYIGKTTTNSKALSKISSIDALYWPINKTEMEANKLLEQNQYYKTTSTTLN